ncbi:energy transducer TonB [Aureibaculum sp. A20]|uniref:Energy transducer TonB n=1 Tax=Aureibaculum flavum TaxID=2795986 RepID=A0ABS0WVV1_9FLAO|nr:energy transducer TonB [Aureibaculum flavum]MBJ2176132.1 energy transducer TonB [Aureibaculum flavum]
MKKQLHISIPKPCHEDWHEMTPNQQGKFCNSCAKTVVDFTKKSVTEIQSFFIENQGKKVCGRFQQKQLDSIIIEIPEQVLFQQRSYSRMFLLALLITMGATLMSCNNDGKKQKINQVIVLDSIANSEISIHEKIDSLGANTKVDSILEKKKDTLIEKPSILPPIPPPPLVTPGLTVLRLPEAVEPVKIIEKDSLVCKSQDSVEIIEITEITGDVFIEPLVFGLIEESPPTFKGSRAKTSYEKKEEFTKKINEFVLSKFDANLTSNLNLKEGKHRIIATFKIDKNGKVQELKVLAPHLKLKEEIQRIINELPQLKPATQRNRPVSINYTLPITFMVE